MRVNTTGSQYGSETHAYRGPLKSVQYKGLMVVDTVGERVVDAVVDAMVIGLKAAPNSRRCISRWRIGTVYRIMFKAYNP